MHHPRPFNVQSLIHQQAGIPTEYRLAELPLLMKAENILQSNDGATAFPQLVNDRLSARHCAARLQVMEELAFLAELRETGRMEAWQASIQSATRNKDTSDQCLEPKVTSSQAQALIRDFRHHILSANQADDDAQWLTLLNGYLAHYGAEALDLDRNSTQDRLFRIRPLATPDKIQGGPLVSVIMPVFNSSPYVDWAARSILDQSWTRLELIMVDDCSTDDSADKIRQLAARDPRVKAISTPRNSGPYVAKNMGLALATGDLITGHDADDWAHPRRIEQQVQYLLAFGQPVCVGHMLRMSPTGEVTMRSVFGSFSPDGILQKASISAMFNADFFHSRLGSWDNVRFGADSELLSRAAIALGYPISFANILTMLCLNIDTSLTNHTESAIKEGHISGNRFAYRQAWSAWHDTLDANSTYLPIDQGRHYFDAPLAMQNKPVPANENPAA